ncbi:hypothetical protein [Streptomyces sp. NPDC002537]
MSRAPAVFRPSPARVRTGVVMAGAACMALLAVQPARASVADDSLLAHVPPAIRGSCSSVAASQLPSSAVGAVSCKPTGGAPVVYMQFPDTFSMQNAYDSDLSNYSFGYTSCDASTPLNGKQPYSVAGQEAGKMACYRDKDGSGNDIEWTNSTLSILSLTKSSSPYDQLLRWWQSAGPVS